MGAFVALAVEEPVRGWLAGALVGVAVLPGPPPSGPVEPYITLSRVGGSPEGGHLRIDAPLLSVECWGRTWDSAAELAARVVGAVESVAAGTPMGPLVCLGAEVALGPLRAPAPGRSLLRYVVDVAMRLRPA